MTLCPVPIVTYRVIEPECMKERELEEALNLLGAQGYQVATFIPRSLEGSAKLILERRVGIRSPGDGN